MCGIVGIISTAPSIDRDLPVRMRDALAHRGPDDAGIWWSPDGRVCLAQRRLAIIDLSPTGHQPMGDTSQQLWVTFNGEIYNHRSLRRELEARGHLFRSESDTEVILEAYRAWGIECLSRLNGMFAFALYDSKARRLFLARDRCGEKPLYYHHAGKRFVFASELKALMVDPAFPRELDLEAFSNYLAHGYVPGERCILKGVRKLGPAQALCYDLDTDTLRVWQYWQLPEHDGSQAASPDELVEELESLLTDSVRLRLIADVPVGILLSGGLDSSLVTALAARASTTTVKTFTIGLPGYGAYDESGYARLVAQHCGTEHTELMAEASSVDLLPELARQYDEPIADSSIVPTYLVSRLVRQHATVALGGDGGDELFGGYPYYSQIQRQERLRHFVPGPLRRGLVAVAARALPVGLKGRNYLIGWGSDLPESIAQAGLFFDARSRQLLSPVLRDGLDDAPEPEAYRPGLCSQGGTPLQQATAADFGSYLVDDILVKVDRASMLASLEVRAPWLDHRVVEFAFGRVPDFLKATETERKILTRRLALRLLPDALDLTRKQGFSIPLASWFRGDWGAFMRSVLSEADPHLFDLRTIRRLVHDQERGFSNINRLFALTMFELWRREYRVTLSA